MISRSVLFYWSKGSDTRRRILSVTRELNDGHEPCFINVLSEKLELSHVAIKKHVELLVEEKYIKQMNYIRNLGPFSELPVMQVYYKI